MENSMVLNEDIDLSCNIFKSLDCSGDLARCDISETTSKDLKYCESFREYFYYTGYTGCTGPTGIRGEMGCTGMRGHMGYTGPTGPTGSVHFSNTFLSVYNTNQQEVAFNNPVVFNYDNSIFGDCIHIPNSSQLLFWRTGYYYVYINLYHIEGCQFSLYKNSTSIISGSTIGSLSGTTQNSSSLILQINDSDMIYQTGLSPSGYACNIELINITPFVQSITLYDASSVGFTIPQINATISIFFLHN
jgi:hypothetical protein